MSLLDNWNKDKFNIYKREEKTVLKLMQVISDWMDKIINLTDDISNLANSNFLNKVSHTEMTEDYKLSNKGDFTGTWNGVEMHLSNEGLASDWNSAKGTFPSVTGRLNENDEKIRGLIMFDVRLFSTLNNGKYTVDTNILNLALKNSKGGTLFFNGDEFILPSPINLCPCLIVTGEGQTKTKITFTGNGNAFQLPSGTDANSQFGFRNIIFKDFALYGNGTNSFGVDATNNGIYIGDENNSALYNVPFIRIYNVDIRCFKKGIYLEGYGHTLQDFYIGSCQDGLTVVHPEQVLVLNPWIEYCNRGLYSNPSYKLQYGHRFTVIGGAVQRNHIGIIIQNLYNVRIQTYCELNDTNDVICGSETGVDSTYLYSVKDLELDINSTNNASDCCIKLVACKYANINFSAHGNATTIPHIKVDGYSKGITIRAQDEFIKSSNPWLIQGDAATNNNVVIMTNNTKEQYSSGTLNKFGFTNSSTGAITEIMELLNQWVDNSNGLVLKMMNDGSLKIQLDSGAHSNFGIKDSNGNTLFSIGSNDFSSVENLNLTSAGTGVLMKTPDGTKRYKVSINDAGQVVTTLL